MTSKMATRPGLSTRGTSNCEITACNTVESWMHTISCWLVGNAWSNGQSCPAAPVVCSVPNTRVAGFRRCDGRFDGPTIAHFAHQNHVRVLAQGADAATFSGEIRHVHVHFMAYVISAFLCLW